MVAQRRHQLPEPGIPRRSQRVQVAENRGSGISMMISQVRRDTGLLPLFAANLDEFRVTIPRTSLVTPELRAWARRLSRGQDLSEAQISVFALASAGYDVDIALLRRLGLGSSDRRRQLSQLRDLGLLQPRRARDDGSYRLAPGLSDIAARDEALSSPGSGLPERILEALGETDSDSREELQEATGASRSSVTNALDHLITSGTVEATAPPAARTGAIGARAHSFSGLCTHALEIAVCERSFQLTATTASA